MACIKCGYKEKDSIKKFDIELCRVCSTFAPQNKQDFEKYIQEKLDWKNLETFRQYKNTPGIKQKNGMQNKAKKGTPMSRPPLGYNIKEGLFIQNKDAIKVISLFRTYLNKNYSLNFISKNFGISINGIKKILTNRSYLGEIKFNNEIYHSTHSPLIDTETFYAVQRKLKTQLRPQNKK